MPRAGYSPVGRHNTVLQRCSVVCALGPNGLDLASGVDKQDLRVEALNLHLLLLAWLKGGQRRQLLDFVFLRHRSG